jgi:PD-(D/E)XK endonuclease
MEHPKAIGDRSTLAIMLALCEAGYDLLVPFGENTRYDLVIDDGMQLARVQCKTGRLRSGAVVFNTCSSYAHHSNPRVVKRVYQGEVDYFAVFCPETRCSYLIPIAELPLKRQGRLRVDPPRNNQLVGIRFAVDFEIRAVTAGLGANVGACRSSA